MAIYTGVADANGDFNIPFSANYTSGQKITVTSEKDSAIKSIELYAPSATIGSLIQFSGSSTSVGEITLTEAISGAIPNRWMRAHDSAGNIFREATGLVILGAVTQIGDYAFSEWKNATRLLLAGSITNIKESAFQNWVLCTSLELPESLQYIGNYAFYGLEAYASKLKIPDGVITIGTNAFYRAIRTTEVEIGPNVTSIGVNAFYQLLACNIFTIRATTPPTLGSNALYGLKSTCVIKVPSASVAAYQAASGWSSFADRIQAI